MSENEKYLGKLELKHYNKKIPIQFETKRNRICGWVAGSIGNEV